MATGFDEMNSLGNMNPGGVNYFVRGRLASFGRGLAGREEKPDPVIQLENQAKMAAYQSQLRMQEHEHAQELRERGKEHATATDIAGTVMRNRIFQEEKEKANLKERAARLQEAEGVQFPESGASSAGASIAHNVDSPEAQSARLQSATEEMFPSSKKE